MHAPFEAAYMHTHHPEGVKKNRYKNAERIDIRKLYQLSYSVDYK